MHTQDKEPKRRWQEPNGAPRAHLPRKSGPLAKISPVIAMLARIQAAQAAGHRISIAHQGALLRLAGAMWADGAVFTCSDGLASLADRFGCSEDVPVSYTHLTLPTILLV